MKIWRIRFRDIINGTEGNVYLNAREKKTALACATACAKHENRLDVDEQFIALLSCDLVCESGDRAVLTYRDEDRQVVQTHEMSVVEAFYTACELAVFSDCTGVENVTVTIHHPGTDLFTVDYGGWKAGIQFDFVDKDGFVFWTEYHPEMDH